MKQSLIGRRLANRYRVDEHLGSGGMGDVYRGWDENIGKAVALKVMSARMLGQDSARMDFRREARKLASIDHHNVATISNCDRDGDMDFIVMEFVSGVTMDEQVQAGPLAESEVVRLGVQLAEGLAAAHKRGIVHSDIKPGNVRVTDNGVVKILDFGIARLIREKGDPDATRTQEPGFVRGTLAYMAPEQMLAADADARQDIYSAGTLLFEVATGRRPFADTRKEALAYQVQNIEPPKPRKINRAVSQQMEAVLLKCLAKDPQDRYVSAEELKRALEAIGTAPPGPDILRRAMWTAAAVSLAAVVWFLWPRQVPPVTAHLAVMPFKNLSSQPDREYLSDGIADELSTRLGRINYGQLRVVGFPATERYKGRTIEFSEVRKTLGVGYVLDGSVTSDATTLLINARLSETESGTQRWSGQYRGRLIDAIDIQRSIADSIAQELAIELRDEVTIVAATARPSEQGYDRFLRGQFLARQRTSTALEEARETLQAATESDPGQASFHAELARTYLLLENFGYWPPNEAMPRALSEARRALVLDPNVALGSMVVASVLQDYERAWGEAEQEYARAIELGPSLPAARQGYASLLLVTGRRDLALEQLQAALELDPLSLPLRADLGAWLYLTGEYTRALEEYERAIELHPEAALIHYQRGITLIQLSQPDEAIRALSRAMLLEGAGDDDVGAMRKAFRESGARGYWRWRIETLKKAAGVAYTPAYQFARAEAALGNLDRAFQFLDFAVEHRESAAVGVVLDPAFETLRKDQRYEPIRVRLGLAPGVSNVSNNESVP